jgi:hypothetical protein
MSANIEITHAQATTLASLSQREGPLVLHQVADAETAQDDPDRSLHCLRVAFGDVGEDSGVAACSNLQRPPPPEARVRELGEDRLLRPRRDALEVDEHDQPPRTGR